MKNILIDLSGKISETSVSVLREIEEVTTRLMNALSNISTRC